MKNERRHAANPGTDRRMFLAAGAAATIGACAAPRATSAAEVQDKTLATRDLFAHLADQSKLVEPISADDRRARRARLASTLRDLKIDHVLLEGGPTMTWLTGVSWGHSERLFAFVGSSDGDHLWVVPGFEESKARQQIDAEGGPGGRVLTWAEDEKPARVLAAHLRERRAEQVAIEPQLRWIFAERLAVELGRERIVSGHPLVVELRARKEPREIALIRRACESTQLAIREVGATLAPGMTGSEVAERMAAAHEKLGMHSPWALCLVGPAAALPHGDKQDIALETGSLLLVDTGASLHGYQSDISRTWIVAGEPTAEIERAWNAVHDAQQKAFERVRPGTVCRDVDAAARAAIVSHGFPGGFGVFTHRLGHGIGLEGHEDPYFDGGNDTVLASGMTLSNEPGIYLPGRFGVRLEDIVSVTDQGGDHFGEWQTSPRGPA